MKWTSTRFSTEALRRWSISSHSHICKFIFFITLSLPFALSATSQGPGDNYTLSPNPATGVIAIISDHAIEDALQITFRDVMGNVLSKHFAADIKTSERVLSVDLSSIPTGILLCQLTEPDGRISTIRLQKT